MYRTSELGLSQLTSEYSLHDSYFVTLDDAIEKAEIVITPDISLERQMKNLHLTSMEKLKSIKEDSSINSSILDSLTISINSKDLESIISNSVKKGRRTLGNMRKSMGFTDINSSILEDSSEDKDDREEEKDTLEPDQGRMSKQTFQKSMKRPTVRFSITNKISKIKNQSVDNSSTSFNISNISGLFTSVKKRETITTNATKNLAPYLKNIKYVKSMLNLWKDEFIRRKRLRIAEPMPDVFTIPESELNGESLETYRRYIPHDQLKSDKVKDMILHNLRTCFNDENNMEDENFVDKPIDNPLKSDRIDEKEISKRWGASYLKNLHGYRSDWANHAIPLNGFDDPDFDEHDIDTLDMMPSMRQQFAIQYRGKSIKQARLELQARDNTKITDFFNKKDLTQSQLKNIKEEKEDLDSEDYILTSTPMKMQKSDSVLSDSIIKAIEDEISDFNQPSFANLTQTQFYESQEIRTSCRYKYKVMAPSVSEIGEILKAKSKEPPHYRSIFYTNENDLVLHYSNKLLRHEKASVKARTKIGNVNKYVAQKRAFKTNGINLRPDMQLPTNVLKRINKQFLVDDTERVYAALKKYQPRFKKYSFPVLAPSTKTVRELCQKQRKIDEEISMPMFKKHPRDTPHEISEETKEQIIRNNRYLAHRGISPCTEKELSVFKTTAKCMKQSTRKKRVKARPGNGQLTLLDIHSDFEQMHSLTTMLIEPIMLTRIGKYPNFALDPICAICILVHSENAKSDLGDQYKPVRIVIEVRDTSNLSIHTTGFLIGLRNKTELKFVDHEFLLIQAVIDIVHHYNPDIIMGYDLLDYSIGFISNMCKRKYDIDFLNLISRSPKTWNKLSFKDYHNKIREKKLTEEMGLRSKDKPYYFDLQVNGRVLYNVIDSMGVSLHLKSYDLDVVAFELLQRREPRFTHDRLTAVYKQGYPARLQVYEHYFHQMDL